MRSLTQLYADNILWNLFLFQKRGNLLLSVDIVPILPDSSKVIIFNII